MQFWYSHIPNKEFWSGSSKTKSDKTAKWIIGDFEEFSTGNFAPEGS